MKKIAIFSFVINACILFIGTLALIYYYLDSYPNTSVENIKKSFKNNEVFSVVLYRTQIENNKIIFTPVQFLRNTSSPDFEINKLTFSQDSKNLKNVQGAIVFYNLDLTAKSQTLYIYNGNVIINIDGVNFSVTIIDYITAILSLPNSNKNAARDAAHP